MTSSSNRGTVISSSSLTGRSLLSRLKSPLQSKTRHFADFYILPDDPHRQYAPGDVISGSVVLKVLRPLRITHLVISLHGYAQVFKNPNAPGDGYRNYSTTIGSGKGKKGGSYFGNGFASLFEDEAVLCGEGRLAEGVYHFNFELEFPSKGLPSSIDFERGTISYMLTSTLTRPTTMSPTTSCDTKVCFQETIDIAAVAGPKSRVISLEPISRRTRAKASSRKRSVARTESSSVRPGTESTDSTRTARVSELNSGTEESLAPGSPAPSDISFGSQVSSGNVSGTEYGIRSINTTVKDNSLDVNWSSEDKTITASIDVLKGGFLRGDQIPVKISVKHTKHVRSLRGIIITLYRQARVDMHPALPVLPNSKGDKTKSEDYYPKSRTGLGGLSLSSAGSSHLFRKDLSQSFAPLFVDPRTLTAEVKCAVRVPEEAFPTISNVPGAMISFKYFVEVVVDIQGKLTRLDRMLPNAGLVNVPSASGLGAGVGPGEDATGSMFSTWGGTFVDTDMLRREKGVISCVFEVVVGTKDSERSGKRKQATKEPDVGGPVHVHEFSVGQPEDAYAYSYEQGDAQEADYGYDQNGQYYDQYAYEEAYAGGYDMSPAYQETGTPRAPQHPPANAESEEGLSEKERMRRAEARLLPSQPPDVGASRPPVSSHSALAPSAPILPEDDDQPAPYFPGPSSSSLQPPPFLTPSQSSYRSDTASVLRRPPDDDNRTVSALETGSQHAPTPGANGSLHHTPSAPQYFPPSSSSSSRVQPTDDKQELQRRRLEMERSAPPEHDEDDTPGPSAPPTHMMQNMSLGPSAPVLEDHDEDLVGPVEGSSGRGHARKPSEALPVYER